MVSSVKPVRGDEGVAVAVAVGAPVTDHGVLEPAFCQVRMVADDDLQGSLVELYHVVEELEVGGDGGPVGVLDG